MNRVEISGRLTTDPKVENTEGLDWWGATIATSVQRFDREHGSEIVKAIFVSVLAKGPVAVGCMGIQKGDEVLVLGELDQYKKAGREGPSTRVMALTVTLLSEGRQSRGAAPQQQRQPEADPWA